MPLQFIFTVSLFTILALSFFKLKWAIAIFVVYMVVVPVISILWGDNYYGLNVVCLFLGLAYFVYALRLRQTFSFKPLLPFIIYFLLTLIEIPFQYQSMDISFSYWKQDMMKALIIPFAIWNIVIHDASSINVFKKSLIIAIIIAVGYGLFQISLYGANPYQMLVIQTMGQVDFDWESYYLAVGSGRLFGRISSVFLHPMSFALFLGLSFIYLLFQKQSMNKHLWIIVFFATSLCILLCGVRSVLGALAIAGIYFLLVRRNYKIILAMAILGLVAFLIISQIPSLSVYLSSMTDVHNSGQVSGSSIEQRFSQLEGALYESEKNPVFGGGYGWTSYYQKIRGDHPKCLAFESLILLIICNMGFIGFVIWGVVCKCYFNGVEKIKNKSQRVLLNMLLIFYIAYSMITGEYGYMKYFLIVYIVMYASVYLEERQRKYESVMV